MKTVVILSALIIYVLIAPYAFAASEFTTPQYSGPGAATDGGMKSPVSPRMSSGGPINSSPSARDRLNDTATEKFIDRRETQIHREMDRRRDEVYRKIRTND